MENFEADNHMNGKEDSVEGNCESKIEENPESKTEISRTVSTPKKRGRKKKSEQLIVDDSTIKSLPMEFDDEVKPRSGRKRKSVNYFALANPDIILEDHIPEKKKIKSPKIQNNLEENKNVVKKVESYEKNGEAPNELNKSEIIKSENETPVPEVKKEKTNENINDDTGILKSLGLKRGSESEDEITTNDVCYVDTEKSDDDMLSRKEKIYRKTGNTTQMLNTLFAQCDFQEEIGNDDSQERKVQPRGQIKRGRPSGKAKVAVKMELGTDSISSDQKTVTCAVCKKEIEKNNWAHHKQRYHNNLAWRIGDTPLDLSNMDLVKQILNALYMARKLFYCEKCDKAMKSVNGFLSHKSVCGKTTEAAKVPCNYCNKKMLPVSLPSHIRHYHEGPKEVNSPKLKKKDTAAVATAKRKAAEKALKVIQHFNLEASGIKKAFMKYFEDLSFVSSNVATTMLQKQILASKKVVCKYPECNFECFSAEDIKQHLKFCMHKPDNGYVCKHCLYVQLTIADIIYHIETVHGVIIKEGDESDSDSGSNFTVSKREKDKKSKKKQNPEKEKSAAKRTPSYFPYEKKLDMIFEKAYEWTLDFYEKYYTTPIPEQYFPCLKANWELMAVNTVEEYLPQMGYSCDVGFETVVDFQDVLHKDHSFRKFHLFESYLENNGNSTIFCGGPINVISWLPTPYTQSGIHQIVAVATKNHPDDKYTNDQNYNEKCVVQFWDVGPLKNSDTSMYRPRLGFCLSFEHGPVWDLQWCPSNCFDISDPPDDSDRLRRMGVLAIAGSDSAVYIYSVPYVKASGQFYDSRPVIKLIPMAVQEITLGNKKFYASKISWSKAAGHKYVAVGYTNGMVAMFNISTESKILRKKDEVGIDTLVPYKSFQAHCHYISAISLYHLNDGCRWLLTGSYDRAVSLWDLNETSSPIQSVKRNIVNDAIWMNNWLCHVIAYDEASTIGQATSIVQQARDFLSDPFYLFHCSAAITCLTGSDWLNGIVQANAVGEIFATFPKQLMINLNWKYLKNKKLLFGYTTLVEKDKTIEERLKDHSEKEKALRNQLTVKTVLKGGELPSNKEITHLDYNPHYYEYEPLVYHEVDAKYGLLFCDHKMNSFADFPPKLQDHMSCSSKMYASSKPNIYPLQAINRIALNPNRQATTYYVSGYQAGFVRLTCMKFLSKDPQIIADSLEFNE
ncbi:hypothetical protein HHI36_006028 [Cryptolaemus montrouzieri]|uniref:C2H2-type domain-containing protein n=1 Tax=Cryptolaemus montrouzieri TaxID=559131 RepID=A0ABD2NW46_9CUCU